MPKLTSAQVTRIVVFVVLVVVLQVVPAVIATQAPIRSAPVWNDASIRPSAAPPSIVFAIVWPILYLLVAGGLTLQSTFPTTAKPAVRWAGVCLIAVTVILTFVWTPVFVRSTVKSVTAATYMIVAMLCVSVPGVVLAYLTRPAAGALLTPLPLWLIFALVLSFQTLHNIKRKAA
jgi:benzodiazapine receptor